MLNAVQAYEFDERAVRVVMVEGDPWFVASDIAVVLGYRDGPTMSRNLDEDEKGAHIVCTLRGEQSLTIISESGLYNAIFKSRREEAQRFRRWVTGEVLPSIRRTGRYEMDGLPPPEAAPLLGDAETARLTAAIGVVREARQVWGPVKTRSIWVQLGLPSPIVDAVEDAQADPIVGQIARLVADKAEVTVNDIAGMLGWDAAQIHMGQRRRIAEALRLLGWRCDSRWRDGGTVKVWTPIPRRVVQAEG